MTSVVPPLTFQPEKYRQLVVLMVKTLADLSDSPTPSTKINDPKYLAQLRLLERSFNFILDNFPQEKVEEVFGHEDWKSIKTERDRLAKKISENISNNPEFLERYQLFCEHLKDLSKQSSFL
jgi:hypothetical protein